MGQTSLVAAIMLKFTTLATANSWTWFQPNEEEPDTMPKLFIRLSIITDKRKTVAVGNAAGPQYRTKGMLYVGIHTELGTGNVDATTVADLVIPDYENVTEGGVRYYSPDPVPVGSNLGYYTYNVIVPFDYDE